MVHVEHRTGVKIISGMRKRMQLEFIFRNKDHTKGRRLHPEDIGPDNAMLTRA